MCLFRLRSSWKDIPTSSKELLFNWEELTHILETSNRVASIRTAVQNKVYTKSSLIESFGNIWSKFILFVMFELWNSF